MTCDCMQLKGIGIQGKGSSEVTGNRTMIIHFTLIATEQKEW